MMLLAAGTAKKHIVSMKRFNAGVQAAARKLKKYVLPFPVQILALYPAFNRSLD